jgi:hypothetical protein
VKYETAEAFRTALEQRLKNEAQATGMALIRLRKRVAFERFLARLATSASSGWVLKGAFALELRLGLRARTTKDIDLGRADGEAAATGVGVIARTRLSVSAARARDLTTAAGRQPAVGSSGRTVRGRPPEVVVAITGLPSSTAMPRASPAGSWVPSGTSVRSNLPLCE